MSYVGNSKIERFRVRYHGANSRLWLLSKGTTIIVPGTGGGRGGGEPAIPPILSKYDLLTVCDRRFFIGRDFDSTDAKHQEILTLDMGKNSELTREIFIADVIACELRLDGESSLRYTFGAKTLASFVGSRVVCVLNAAFNDKGVIGGV